MVLWRGVTGKRGKRCLSRVAPDSRVIFVPTFLHTCSMRWKRIACENMDGTIILLP